MACIKVEEQKYGAQIFNERGSLTELFLLTQYSGVWVVHRIAWRFCVSKGKAQDQTEFAAQKEKYWKAEVRLSCEQEKQKALTSLSNLFLFYYRCLLKTPIRTREQLSDTSALLFRQIYYHSHRMAALDLSSTCGKFQG